MKSHFTYGNTLLIKLLVSATTMYCPCNVTPLSLQLLVHVITCAIVASIPIIILLSLLMLLHVAAIALSNLEAGATAKSSF